VHPARRELMEAVNHQSDLPEVATTWLPRTRIDRGFTMRRVHFTIGAMCMGIALLAIEIVIWKTDLFRYGVWVLVGIRGTLIATTVFAFTLARLLAGGGSRPFLVEFLTAGFSAELVYWVCCWLAPWQVLAYLQNPVDQAVIVAFYFDGIPGLEHALLQGSPNARLFFDMTCFPLIVAIHSLPLLAVAVAGGWATRKHATMSQRPRPVTT
jgi:hypothetical protein